MAFEIFDRVKDIFCGLMMDISSKNILEKTFTSNIIQQTIDSIIFLQCFHFVFPKKNYITRKQKVLQQNIVIGVSLFTDT